MEANTNITNGEVYDWYISVGRGLSVKETFKVFKEKFELPGYQQSDTRPFSKLQTLEKKIKALNVKKMTLMPVMSISRNTSLTSSLEMLEKEQYINLEQIRHEKHKLQKGFSYSQKRLKQYTAGLGDPNKREILEDEVDTLETEVKRLTSENKDLQQLVSLLEKDEVTTFENGRYTSDVREVIMELLNLNVSISKINLVITAVLTKLGSKKLVVCLLLVLNAEFYRNTLF